MPYQFTRKILNQLINSGYVISRDGAGGGFRLIEDPDSIKLVELIGIFQGRIQLSECMFRNKLCHNRDTCVLRENIKRIERIIEDEFREITIGSLLDQMRKKNER
jgi:Rrf2 family protein